MNDYQCSREKKDEGYILLELSQFIIFVAKNDLLNNSRRFSYSGNKLFIFYC